jgi:hypothetical protein
MTNIHVHQDRFASVYVDGSSLTVALRDIPEYILWIRIAKVWKWPWFEKSTGSAIGLLALLWMTSRKNYEPWLSSMRSFRIHVVWQIQHAQQTLRRATLSIQSAALQAGSRMGIDLSGTLTWRYRHSQMIPLASLGFSQTYIVGHYKKGRIQRCICSEGLQSNRFHSISIDYSGSHRVRPRS